MRLLVAAIILLATGCSNQLFSAPALSKVDATLPMARANPGKMKGAFVMAGGVIRDLRNAGRRGELVIDELPLDSHGKPKGTATPVQGLFILASNDRLDPQVYRPGLMVSAIAEVLGTAALGSGENQEKQYPLLAVRELRLWTGR